MHSMYFKLSMNSRQTTNWFKGAAILAVIISHYFQYYTTPNLDGWVIEYANGLIFFFFIFSGFGIYHSMERRFSNGISASSLKKYYLDRALRIFPLYWIALFIVPWFQSQQFYSKLHHLNGIIYYTGFPAAQAPGIYWFITSIIQCYLLSPLFFIAIKKWGIKRFLISCGCFTLILIPISFMVFSGHLNLPNFLKYPFEYRFFFGAHLLLFGLGMIIAIFSPSLFKSGKMLFLFFVILSLSIYFTRYKDMLFHDSASIIAPVFIGSSFLFCLNFLVRKARLPFKFLSLLGIYSYPLYLFHLPFYGLLDRLGLLRHDSIYGAIVILLFSPIFMLFCFRIETIMDFFERRFMRFFRPVAAS